MDTALTSHGAIAALGITLAITATITVPLRFYARYKQHNIYGPDDWTIIPAYTCFMAMVAISWFGIHTHFMGYDTANARVNASNKEEFEKMYIVNNVFSVLCLGFTKISALLFFRRIFCVGHKRDYFSYATIFGLVIVTLWILAMGTMVFFECGTHISVTWTENKALFEKTCTNDYKVLKALIISAFLLDFFVLLLPIPKILLLHATIGRRVAIIGVFLLALVGLAASITRLVLLLQLLGLGLVHNMLDPYLADSELAFLYLLEAGFGLISVNLPSLWYFNTKVKPESVVRSLRSFRSLTSIRSKKNNTDRISDHKIGQSSLSSSQTRLAYPKGNSIETVALTEMNPKVLDLEFGNSADEIKVVKNFEQTIEQV